MLKLLGAVLVLLSCGAIGVRAAEEKKKRLKSLREIKEIFITLQGEIRYGGTHLKEAIEAVTGMQSKEQAIAALFFGIAVQMEDRCHGGFYGIWEKEWLAGARALALEKKDLERLFRVGKTLGQLDRETELRCMEEYLLELSGDIVQEEKTIRERIRLCHWLGALAGIFICILMV